MKTVTAPSWIKRSPNGTQPSPFPQLSKKEKRKERKRKAPEGLILLNKQQSNQQYLFPLLRDHITHFVALGVQPPSLPTKFERGQMIM
jgi:hypothetical protein